jgi:hypothetical protein
VSANVSVPEAASESGGLFGVFARYLDANNWVGAFVDGLVDPFGGIATNGYIYKRVGGALTQLAVTQLLRVPRVSLTVIGSQAVAGWSDTPISDVDLAVGGPLASGGHGIYDYSPAGSGNRDYDNFRVDPIVSGAVLAASRTAELSTDGMARQDATGIAYGPVSHVTGDNPRLPPSGLEERPVELFLKGSRGDLGQLPDPSASDGLTARVYARPTFIAP